ncbi:MAG: ABC transporter ATP-binding protein [Pseudomonadota bacterium]|nr:ABC transporter ATP-binding protein [Pseudomonadota bacterium]
MLSAENLRKAFQASDGAVDVLRGVSLKVAKGESVALTGESGSGKSTLLHCLGCLEDIDSGTIFLNGDVLHDLDDDGKSRIRRQKFGIVFQQLNLIPSLTVVQNLSFHARLAGREDTGWTQELADKLGLAALLHRYPEQLSGGQQQRVAIGRAIASRPEFVLADEPTGNLDEDTAEAVMTLLQDLVKEAGAGLLMVTHSERHASKLDRRLHLKNGLIA